MVGIKYETPSCLSPTALSLSLTYLTYHSTNINQFLAIIMLVALVFTLSSRLVSCSLVCFVLRKTFSFDLGNITGDILSLQNPSAVTSYVYSHLAESLDADGGEETDMRMVKLLISEW